MKCLKEKSKKQSDVVEVIATEVPERYLVQVYIEMAYDFIERGYDSEHFIKVTVAKRNFQEDIPSRKKQQFAEKGKPGKKKYVEKEETPESEEHVEKKEKTAKIL
jgi:predicted metal-dependent phosphoesterase TrpH